MERSSGFLRLTIDVIGTGVIAAGIVFTVVVLLWVRDIRKDRQHTVSVKSDTPLFAGKGDESCGESLLGLIRPGTEIRVQRIRYWKNCATIDVVSEDGRKGYIVLGDGDISVRPPLH